MVLEQRDSAQAPSLDPVAAFHQATLTFGNGVCEGDDSSPSSIFSFPLTGAALVVKDVSAGAGDIRDLDSMARWGRSQEKGMATHSSILAWRIPWTEEPGGPQSIGSQSRT